MSTGGQHHDPAPLEYFHGRLMELFHAHRQRIFGETTRIPFDGTDLNNIIAQAKKLTYEKYPDVKEPRLKPGHTQEMVDADKKQQEALEGVYDVEYSASKKERKERISKGPNFTLSKKRRRK